MAVVWPEVLEVVGDRPLVAHFAAFDMSVLRNALTADGSEWPNLTYFCTCTLAKRGWPGMLSYRLVDLADECGLTFQHHEPGADAATAAELAIACCGLASERQLDAASKALGVRAGQLSSDGWAPSGVAPQRLSDLTPTVNHIPGRQPVWRQDHRIHGHAHVRTNSETRGAARGGRRRASRDRRLKEGRLSRARHARREQGQGRQPLREDAEGHRIAARWRADRAALRGRLPANAARVRLMVYGAKALIS